jgi:GNAT superfamily N-acetyltransferase
MKIRLATIDDAPLISALVHDLAKEFIAHELSEEAASLLLGSMDEYSIKRYIESGYRYHVAEENGELAGVVAVRDSNHLYHLFVSKRFQSQGLARRLWEVAKTASLRTGNPGLSTVNSSLCAVSMYEKFGFIRQSEAVNSSGVVCISMKLELVANMAFERDAPKAARPSCRSFGHKMNASFFGQRRTNGNTTMSTSGQI